MQLIKTGALKREADDVSVSSGNFRIEILKYSSWDSRFETFDLKLKFKAIYSICHPMH